MLLKVRMQDSKAMEALLKRLYDMPDVVSTKTYVALSTYLERPVQAGITEFKIPRHCVGTKFFCCLG
jgi:hypothetical protein